MVLLTMIIGSTFAETDDSFVESLDRNVSLGEDEVYGEGTKVYWNDAENLVILDGKAFLKYENVEMYASKIWYDFKNNLIKAEGGVGLKIDQEQTYAENLIFDVKRKVGRMSEGFAFSHPWFYGGNRISKIGEKDTLAEKGFITSCSLKHPHYWFEASKIIVKVDKELIARNVILKIGDVPLLWLPIYRRDLRKEKQARVIFKLGMTSYQGYFMYVIYPIVRGPRFSSEAFFEYTSRRGTGEGIEARYNVNDVRLREIFIEVPKGASRIEARQAEDKANEILQRLRGEYDRLKLQQIFVKYEITESDWARAEEQARNFVRQVRNGEKSFIDLAKSNSDDMTTKYTGGDLGYVVKGEGKVIPELEESVFSLEPGSVTDPAKTDEGYIIYFVDDILEQYGSREFRLRKLFVRAKPSEESNKLAQAKADEAEQRIKNGEDFVSVAKSVSDEPVDLGWIGLNNIDPSAKYRIKRLNPGEVTGQIKTEDGIRIYRLIEREDTPTFEELAREFSEGKEAEKGGDLGYRGRWELPREINRVAYAMTGEQGTVLDEGDVSRVIRSRKGYHIVKLEDRRFFNGDFYFFTGDIYSYSRTESKKTGRKWDLRYNHRQVISTPWDSREDQRGLILLTKAALGRRSLIGGYGTPSSELRTMASLTWTTLIGKRTISSIPSRLLARLTVDKTFDLAEERSYAVQELPELSISWSGGKLYELPGLKQTNDALKKLAKKLEISWFPLLTIPTLDNMFISSDATIGNYYKAEYGQETDIYLQTGQVGLDASKEGTINLTRSREVRYQISGDTNLIRHQKDRIGNKNILIWRYGLQSSATMNLFRIYDISFIPRANKMKHSIDTDISFDYTPEIEQRQNLYPFGPTASSYERKRLRMELSSKIEIKTRRNNKYTLVDFSTYTARDFTENEYLAYRKWDYIRSRLQIYPTPSRDMSLSFNSTHDPNERDGRRFKQIGFSSSFSYRRGDYSRGWQFHLGNQFTKYYDLPSRTILAGFDLRPSRLFQVEVNVQYDWVKRSFYSQRITIRRDLHDWDLRLNWYQIGFGESARKDFTFQINLKADPSVALGVGYDAVTESWGIRSLPVGVPYGFTGRGLGRSY